MFACTHVHTHTGHPQWSASNFNVCLRAEAVRTLRKGTLTCRSDGRGSSSRKVPPDSRHTMPGVCYPGTGLPRTASLFLMGPREGWFLLSDSTGIGLPLAIPLVTRMRLLPQAEPPLPIPAVWYEWTEWKAVITLVEAGWVIPRSIFPVLQRASNSLTDHMASGLHVMSR